MDQSKDHAAAYTPAPGSQARQAIMDFIRLDWYNNDPSEAHRNSQGVFFNVSFLKVHDNWALTCIDPVNAAGKEIADFRWILLQRKSRQWSRVNYILMLSEYEFRHPDAAPIDELDMLDMSTSTIRQGKRIKNNRKNQ